MSPNLIAALIAFAGGCAISYLNSLMSMKMMISKNTKTAMFPLIRQALSMGYLAAVFFLSRKTEVNIAYPLIGAAVGLTIPSIIFAFILSNRLRTAPPEEPGDGKLQEGGDNHT